MKNAIYTQKKALGILFDQNEFIHHTDCKWTRHLLTLWELTDRSESISGQNTEYFTHFQYVVMNSFPPGAFRRLKTNILRHHTFTIEYDIEGYTPDQQINYWKDESTMPISVAVFSGNKSVHVSVRLEDDLSYDEWESIACRLRAVFADADHQVLKNPAQLVRMPGGTRDENGKVQSILYAARRIPNAEFERWLAEAFLTVSDEDKEKAKRKDSRPSKVAGRRAQEGGAPKPVDSEHVPEARKEDVAIMEEWWKADNEREHRWDGIRRLLVRSTRAGILPDRMFAAALAIEDIGAWTIEHSKRKLADMVDSAWRHMQGQAIHESLEHEIAQCLIDGTEEEQKILKACYQKRAEVIYGDEDELRVLIRRMKAKRMNGIEPMTPLRTVDSRLDSVSDAVERTAELYSRLYHPLSERTMMAAALLEDCLETGDNLILDLPCGTGKSVGATIVAAALASSERRIWFVTQKVETVLAVVNKLKGLGANAKAWHSFHPMACESDVKPTDICQIYSSASPCKKCTLRHDCTSFAKMESRDIEPTDAEIVVTTHAHWRTIVESGELPESVRHIIVDEAPSIFEFLTLGQDELTVLRSTLCSGEEFAEWFDSMVESLKRRLSGRACRRIDTRLLHDSLLRMRRALAQKRKDPVHELAIPATDISAEKAFELAYRFIRVFSPGGTVYGFADNDKDGNARISFARDSMPPIRGAQTLILDGSASLSEVRWEGFEILSCDAFANEYPNMQIHLIDSSSTQTSLRKEDIVDGLRDLLWGWDSNNLLTIANKNLSEKGLHDLDLMLWCLDSKKMNVGEHVGSNKGRQCDACLVAGAFFTGLADVVLRTALATGSEIEAGRIWRGPYPKLGKKGFSDLELDAALTRILVREIEQAFNRGVIRENPSARYFAAAVVGGQAATELAKRFPGAKIVLSKASLMGKIMDGTALAEIAKSLEGPPSTNKKQASRAAKRLHR